MTTLLAMAAYTVLLAGLVVLIAASAGALREWIRRRGRLRGLVVSLGVLFGSLAGIWALLV